jgi:hypothetical protein
MELLGHQGGCGQGPCGGQIFNKAIAATMITKTTTPPPKIFRMFFISPSWLWFYLFHNITRKGFSIEQKSYQI